MENINLKNIEEVWKDVKNRVIELDVDNKRKVTAFLPALKPQVISDDFLMLTTNNQFIRNWIETNIVDLIQKALLDLYGNNFEIKIEVDKTQGQNSDQSNNNNNNNNNSLENTEQILKEHPQEHLYKQKQEHLYKQKDDNLIKSDNNSDKGLNKFLNNETINNTNTEPMSIFEGSNEEANISFGIDLSSLLTFENFVIGNSNNIAYQMARAVAEVPGKPNLNPLFIYGKSGVGKTHLLYAIKNYLKINNPLVKVIYVDATEFVSQYTAAATSHDINKSSFQNFRYKYEDTHVLLIDDLQLLQNKPQTLNIFFSIFNNITKMGRQIVISADRAPKNIDVDERYQSRFNNGMSCEITSPEVEVKLGIINTFIEEFKEEDINVDNYFSDEVKNYIAQNSSSNIRELKSAITKIAMQGKTQQKYFNVNDIKVILDQHFSNNIKKRITVSKIQKTVENFYNINHSSLVGKKKDREIAYARQIAMYLCYKLLDITVSSIGKCFNRDHSTVLHSIKVVEERLKTNRQIAEEIEVLENIIFEN